MEKEKLRSKIELLLFVAGEPVGLGKIMKLLKVSEDELLMGIENLDKFYIENNSGLRVIRKNDELQLVSNPDEADLALKFLNKEVGQELSLSALEVLAVVAYRGPITRAGIEQIRGVNCSFTLRNLAMRGLIERKDNPADTRSYLYEASFEFLKSLGILKIEDLPDYKVLKSAVIPQEQTVGEGEIDSEIKKNKNNNNQDKDD